MSVNECDVRVPDERGVIENETERPQTPVSLQTCPFRMKQKKKKHTI